VIGSKIFMQVPGIHGGVSEPNHEGWIGLLSIGWRRDHAIRTDAFSNKDYIVVDPIVREIEVQREKDAASNNPFQWFTAGADHDIIIDFLSKIDDNESKLYYQIRLSGATIKSIENKRAECVTETLHLDFIEIRCTSFRTDRNLSLMALFGLES
jgi:type VI protein secretion system component Hcp